MGQDGAFLRLIWTVLTVVVLALLLHSFLYHYFPKPELNGLGATFAECEFRHSEAYSRILEVNGYLDEFSIALQNPIFKSYNDFVGDIMRDQNKSIVEKLLFFALVVGFDSLYSTRKK